MREIDTTVANDITANVVIWNNDVLDALYGDFVALIYATSIHPRIKKSVTAALNATSVYAGNMNRSSLCAWAVRIQSHT